MDTTRVFQSVDASLSHKPLLPLCGVPRQIGPGIVPGLDQTFFCTRTAKIVRLPFVIASGNGGGRFYIHTAHWIVR